MDRIKVILICTVALCFLVACSKGTEPERINAQEAGSEQVSQVSAAATETATKAAAETEATTATRAETTESIKEEGANGQESSGKETSVKENGYTDEKGYLILTGRGFETGELNAYGEPELSGYTGEELYEMFADPDYSEADYFFVEPLPDHDDMEYDEVDEDFEPDWPDEEYRDLDISELFENEGEDGYSTGVQGEYSYIFPDGLPKGLKEGNGPDGYMITGTADKDTYKEIVGRLKDAGFTRNAEEMDISGISMFDAQNSEGKYVTAMLMNGQLTVAITE